MKLDRTRIVRSAALAALALAALAHAQAPAAPAKPAQPAAPAPAAPAKPAASAPAPAAGPKELPFEGAKPSARDVLRKHLEAVGGETGWSTKSQMRTTGTLEIPSAGLKGTLEMIALTPDKVLTTVDIAGMGKTSSGTDGTDGWSIDPMRGPALMGPAELAQLRQDGDFLRDLALAREPGKAEVTGLFDFEGAPCWRVTLPAEGGAKESHRFYDRETGLMRGVSMKMPTPMGEIPATVVSTEYKDFGAVKVATRTVMKVMGQQQVMTVDTVAWEGVDPKAFELPEEIKALKSAAEKPADAKPADAKPAGR